MTRPYQRRKSPGGKRFHARDSAHHHPRCPEQPGSPGQARAYQYTDAPASP
jgi:hypothetical protein